MAGSALVITHAPVMAATTSPAPTVAFRPAINPVIDVIAPDGFPRQYPTSTGTTMWSPTSGFAIVKGDKIKLNVFVATGGYELKSVKVRMDNVLLATIDKQPWNTVIDTSTIDAGYHVFEIWAQSDSPSPASSGEQNIMFYIGQTTPAGSEVKSAAPETVTGGTPAVTPPTVTPPAVSTAPAVKSATAAPEDITSIPFGSGKPVTKPATPAVDAGAPQVEGTQKAGSSTETIVGGPAKVNTPIMPPSFPMPTILNDLKYSPSSTVGLKLADGTILTGVTDKPIILTNPIDLTVNVPRGSTTRRFAYALYREGSIVYQTDQQLPATSTRIRLQARNGAAAGLLPGNVVLKAWGVDQNSNYGPATVIKIQIPAANSAEEGVK
jgi:hypothetical protein